MRSHRPIVLVLALALAACSGGDDDAATTTTARPTTTTTPDQLLDGVLASAEGLQLGDVAPELETEVMAEFSDEQVKQSVRALSIRTAVKGEETQALVLLLAFDERLASAPGFKDRFLQDLSPAPAAPPEAVPMSGQDVTYTEEADGSKTMLWAGARLGLIVFGNDRAEIEPVAQSLMVAVTART